MGKYYTNQLVDSIKEKTSYNYAVDFYDKAIQHNSQYFDAYVDKLKVLHNNGKYTECLLATNNSLKIFPNNAQLLLVKGVDKYAQDDYSGAILDIDKAIESNKLDSNDYTNAYKFRSDIFFVKDSSEKALQDINKAILYSPDDFELYETRGNIYKKLLKKDLACENYRKAADLGDVTIYKLIKSYCK